MNEKFFENQEQAKPGDSKISASVLIKWIGAICLLFLSFYLIYTTYAKDKIVEISSEKLSELLKMDVRFDSYELMDIGQLIIHNLSISTPYPQEDYLEHNEFHADWFSIKMHKISINNFDYQSLIQDKKFNSNSITIDSAEIDVYRDKTLPNPPFKFKPLWATMLQKLKFELNIDTLYLNKSNVRYFEKSKFSDQAGRVHFSDTHAVCYNITNNEDSLKQDQNLRIDMRGKAMGVADIRAKTTVDLMSRQDAFEFEAEVESFNASIMNRILSGVLPVAITGGQVHSVSVRMQADDFKAGGTVAISYENLDLEVFEKEDQQALVKIAANVAAKALIRENNLKSSDAFKIGQIDFERRRDRSIFNYWWKSIQAGIIDAMMTDSGKFLQLDEKAKEMGK